MHLPFLLALFAADGGHAAFHPADSALYFEVPDVAGLSRNYREAPLARLLADEELARFAADAAGRPPEDYRLAEELLGALEAALEQALPPHRELLAVLPKVRGFSISIAAPARDGPAEEAEDQPREVGTEPPHYALLAAVSLPSAEAAGSAFESVARLVESIGGDLARRGELSVGGVDATLVQRELPPFGPGVSLWACASGETLFVGLGHSGPDTLASRIAGTAEPLAADPEFRAGRARHTETRGTVVYEYFVRLRGLREAMDAADIPHGAGEATRALLESVAPANAFHAQGRTRLAGGRFVSERWRSRSAGERGLFDVFGAGPIPEGAAERLPADAIFAYLALLDRELLLRALGALLSRVEPTPAKQAEEAGEDRQARGSRLLVELAGALGPTCAIYVLPVSGLTLPRVHALIELRDAQAFERSLAALAEFLEKTAGDTVRVGTRPYRSMPFFTFAPRSSSGELAESFGAPSEVASFLPALLDPELAVTVMDGRALLGLGGMPLKREIRRLLGEGSGELHPLASAERPYPTDAVTVGYADFGAMIAGYYDAARAFVPLIAQATDALPFDLTGLPDSSLFTRHLRPTLWWTRELPEGVLSRCESSFGPEFPLGIVLGGAILASGGGRAAPQPRYPQAIELPAPAEPEPPPLDEQLEHTRRALREVRLALVVYRTDQGRYPASLESLLAPTERFPTGFLEGGVLPLDGWGQALHYTVQEEGAAYRLWSRGPDRIDQGGEGDDLRAP